ncbi:MAG: hypothetical protein JWP35_1255 [Caulobacter sp.]|nr:hypothetical protein [Caulobacter sp.]
MSIQTEVRADLVGRYVDGGQSRFLPASRAELDRAAESLAAVIATFGFTRGQFVLVISMLEEAVQVGPIEQACMDLGLVPTNADNSPFDAARVEAILRRFDVPAVCGVGMSVLEGLKMFGHDPAAIFAGRVVWVRPDAYEAVAAMPGVTARRWTELGPALALECAEGGGAHVDAREWTATDTGGDLRLSSRLLRSLPFRDASTGLKGRVDHAACACGCPDPRVTVEA